MESVKGLPICSSHTSIFPNNPQPSHTTSQSPSTTPIYSPHTSSTPPYLHIPSTATTGLYTPNILPPPHPISIYLLPRSSNFNYIPTFNQSHLSRIRRGTPIPPERKPRWSPTDSSPTPAWLWLPFHPGKGIEYHALDDSGKIEGNAFSLVGLEPVTYHF